MNKLLLSALFSIFMLTPFLGANAEISEVTNICERDIITKIIEAVEDKDVCVFQQAARGCCSWHGGVCGCSNGRALCCDGQLSPSCGCD